MFLSNNKRPARVDSTRAGFRRVLDFLYDIYKIHAVRPIKGHRISSLNIYEYVQIQGQAMSAGTLRSIFTTIRTLTTLNLAKS